MISPDKLVGLHSDIAARDYHADRISEEQPSLNHSIVKVLLEEAPIHAWSHHPRLGNAVSDDPSPEKDFGLACHRLCLGAGAPLVFVDADSWKTTKAKEQRDAAREDGKIPILRHKLKEAEELAEALRSGLKKRGLLEQWEAAQSEVVAIWREGQTLCRAMFDKVLVDEARGRVIIRDLKTTESVKPKTLAKQVFNLHYDSQRQWYVGGAEKLFPQFAGRIEFEFVFIEARFPYAMQVANLDGSFRATGCSKVTRALQTWEGCMRDNLWPEYSKENPLTLEAPEYAANSEFAQSPIHH